MLFPEHSVFFETRLQLEMNISLSLQHTAVGFPEPKSVKTPSQTIQTIFQTKDTERYFQLSKAVPFACWNFLLSYPFSHQAVKGWLLSVFCTLYHQSGHSLGWNHPRISETSHLLWPLAIWTHLITLFQFAGLPLHLSGQDPSFPWLLKSQASNLDGS